MKNICSGLEAEVLFPNPLQIMQTLLERGRKKTSQRARMRRPAGKRPESKRRRKRAAIQVTFKHSVTVKVVIQLGYCSPILLSSISL